MDNNVILQLAADHGLQLITGMTFNEMGLDFKVVFATDTQGQRWVLRIPRRTGLDTQIDRESRILNLVKQHLTVSVPDWRICTPQLVAYPLLADQPALTYDPITYAVTWHMDQDGEAFVYALARILVQLHGIPLQEAKAADIPSASPEAIRRALADKLDTVKRELGMSAALEHQLRAWLDNDPLWPDTPAFIHGDLFAGHILTRKNGDITGIIDWSEGQVGDPAVDFAGHAAVFGPDSLRALIGAYEQAGGHTWDGLFEQALARQAATPLVYAHFALSSGNEAHIEAAKAQLVL